MRHLTGGRTAGTRGARARRTGGAALGAVLALAGVGAAGCASRPARAPRTPAELARSDSLTAARHGVTARELDEQRAGRVEELFAGRFPGVQVYAANGGMLVRVRSASSFRGPTQPLFVVDGQTVEPTDNGIISINPRDVARIEVIKDPGQLALYGSRGANGVVKITTKR
jgi:TonB-dependent SusC/RagA subfamily outer membrane receptor